MVLNVSELGQVFTPSSVVEKMLSLRQNNGRVLEPSSGNGMFLSKLGQDAVGVEIDSKLTKDKRVFSGDFFDYPFSSQFDTVIGNPPYVRYQDIRSDTKKLLDMDLFDRRSNLYLFFIAKCINHLREGGELILITPRDFIKATSAKRLNALLYSCGSMTHYYELGDAAIFDGASPNCAIWRWEKGRQSRSMKTGGVFQCAKGQLWFGAASENSLDDYFQIKVGAVSGADEVFINHQRGCTKMVCSTTAKDGKTRKVIYNRKDDCLNQYKERLLGRRIRKFDESNWWEWGRKYCQRDGERIYVNAKTRNKNPFFVHDAPAYDGSILALFPITPMDIFQAVDKLNDADWQELGFVCDGRFLFTQRSLESAAVNL